MLTQLGFFQITGQIGVGGMGEVYRATDTRLGREVAIKTLPAAFADDKDRLARFEREARLLASLHHAHIASVFSLDEHDGVLYIAMELVAGETLEEKLKAGALPVEDALQLGLQIALALEAAHEKGVVHRDLKPANIMVTPDGVVKVLDFGLAKGFMGGPAQASPAHSPALSVAMTQQGLILGTAGYMSPEQASGQATDHRADVWAFGLVLYEMLTGMPVFGGESVPHILADVLRTEPDWSRLPKNLHPRIRDLLERCLEKKPRGRYHSIADARIDIEKVLSDPRGTALPSRSTGAWRIALPLAVGAAFVAGFGVWVTTMSDAGIPAEPKVVTRFVLNLPGGAPATPSSSEPGRIIGIPRLAVTSLDWSHAGDALVYAAASLESDPSGVLQSPSARLYLRRMDQETADPLAGTEGAALPFFSPDDAWIAYFVGSTLRRLSLATGNAETIVPDIGETSAIHGATWGDDGTIIFGLTNGLYRVPASGGEPALIASTGSDSRQFLWYTQPELLPGSAVLLYHAYPGTENPAEARLIARDLETGTETTLLTGAMDPHYIAATGHLLFARQGTLMAVGFNPDTLAIEGSPFVVVDDVMHAVGTLNGLLETGAAQFAVSASGHLAYVGGGTYPSPDRIIVRTSPAGQEERILPDSAAYALPRMSPDGNRLAFTLNNGRGSSIQIRDLARGVTRRLNVGSFRAGWPLWSADGTSILYSSSLADGVFNLYSIAADGDGEPVRLAPSPVLQVPTDWSSEGVIAYAECRDGTCDIWTLPPDGDPAAFVASDADEMHASFSRDGRWLAYSSDETGRAEVYVRPYPGPGPATQISSSGGSSPAWSADDSQIFYLDGPSQRMMVVDVTPAGSFAAGRPEVLLESWIYGYYFPGRGYDVLPDGSFVVASVDRIAARDNPGQSLPDELLGREIHVVMNFTEELRRRAAQ